MAPFFFWLSSYAISRSTSCFVLEGLCRDIFFLEVLFCLVQNNFAWARMAERQIEPEWLNETWARMAERKIEPERNMSHNGWTQNWAWMAERNMSLDGWTKHEPWWLKTHCEEGIEAEVKGKAETTLGHCCDSRQSSHTETITFPTPLACRYTLSSLPVLREHPLRPWSTNRFFCMFWPPPSEQSGCKNL